MFPVLCCINWRDQFQLEEKFVPTIYRKRIIKNMQYLLGTPLKTFWFFANFATLFNKIEHKFIIQNVVPL